MRERIFLSGGEVLNEQMSSHGSNGSWFCSPGSKWREFPTRVPISLQLPGRQCDTGRESDRTGPTATSASANQLGGNAQVSQSLYLFNWNSAPENGEKSENTNLPEPSSINVNYHLPEKEPQVFITVHRTSPVGPLPSLLSGRRGPSWWPFFTWFFLGDMTKKQSKVVKTILWLCGMESKGKEEPPSRADPVIVSLEEIPLVKTLLDINLIVCISCAIFLWGYFA